jgi:hypothetical protein
MLDWRRATFRVVEIGLVSVARRSPEVLVAAIAEGGPFPFRLRRQTFANPVRIGLSILPRDIDDRVVRPCARRGRY